MGRGLSRNSRRKTGLPGCNANQVGLGCLGSNLARCLSRGNSVIQQIGHDHSTDLADKIQEVASWLEYVGIIEFLQTNMLESLFVGALQKFLPKQVTSLALPFVRCEAKWLWVLWRLHHLLSCKG